MGSFRAKKKKEWMTAGAFNNKLRHSTLQTVLRVKNGTNSKRVGTKEQGVNKNLNWLKVKEC
jgi:hypothetical protein